MEPDDVTLAIPCYNVEDTLPEVLRAVDQLDPSPVTVLCVYDKSTDNTKRIIKEQENVRLIELPENKGIAAAKNAALSKTTTDGLAFVDADIVPPPNWLEKICQEMSENEADYIQGRFVDQITTLGDQWRKRHVSPAFPDRSLSNTPVNGANILADTNALRDIGGWNEQLQRAGEDMDLAKRLIEAGYKVYYTPIIRTTHIRTDTWKETIRTRWKYDNYNFGGNPTQTVDILRRIPIHIFLSCERMYRDIRQMQFQVLWISFIQLFYYIKWDIIYVNSKKGAKDSL